MRIVEQHARQVTSTFQWPSGSPGGRDPCRRVGSSTVTTRPRPFIDGGGLAVEVWPQIGATRAMLSPVVDRTDDRRVLDGGWPAPALPAPSSWRPAVADLAGERLGDAVAR